MSLTQGRGRRKDRALAAELFGSSSDDVIFATELYEAAFADRGMDERMNQEWKAQCCAQPRQLLRVLCQHRAHAVCNARLPDLRKASPLPATDDSKAGTHQAAQQHQAKPHQPSQGRKDSLRIDDRLDQKNLDQPGMHGDRKEKRNIRHRDWARTSPMAMCPTNSDGSLKALQHTLLATANQPMESPQSFEGKGGILSAFRPTALLEFFGARR